MKELLIAAALLCTFSVQAQKPQEMKKMTPQERAERHSKMMEQKLKLNESQAAQIRKINNETALKMEAPAARTHADRALIKEINQNREAEYKRVLTPEQFSTYEANQADRKNKMKARMGEGRQSPNMNQRRMEQPQMMKSRPEEVR